MDEMQSYGAGDVEILPPTRATFEILRAQIDVAVATARSYPRQIKQCQKSLIDMVSIDETTTEQCIYRLERKKRVKNPETGLWGEEIVVIQGPSIRFAELVAAAWGHLRVEARIVDEGKEFMIVQGSCHDLFTNNFWSSEIPRRITNNQGKRFSADMIQVTAAAAASIAQRNAVLKAIPQPLWTPAYQAVIDQVTGNVGKVAEKRMRAIGNFALIGVPADAVLRKIGRSRIEEVTGDDLVRLFGVLQAIREDQTTVDAEFGGRDSVTSEGATSGRAAASSPLSATEDNEDPPGGEGAGQKAAASVPAPAKPAETAASPARTAAPAADPAPARPARATRQPRGARQDADADAPKPADPPGPAAATDEKPATTATEAQPAGGGIDGEIRNWERDCENATSIAELRGVAAGYGPKFNDVLNAEQEAHVKDVYDASEKRINDNLAEKRRKSAGNAYAAARDGGAEEPVGGEQEGGTAAVQDPPAPASSQAVVEPHVDWDALQELAPSKPEDLKLWRELVIEMASATTQEGVNLAYQAFETDRRLEQLPEDVRYNMRAVRFTLRKTKPN